MIYFVSNIETHDTHKCEMTLLLNWCLLTNWHSQGRWSCQGLHLHITELRNQGTGSMENAHQHSMSLIHCWAPQSHTYFHTWELTWEQVYTFAEKVSLQFSKLPKFFLINICNRPFWARSFYFGGGQALDRVAFPQDDLFQIRKSARTELPNRDLTLATIFVYHHGLEKSQHRKVFLC